MRLSALAAAAALLLAAPAAAQPDPDPAQILLGALERARENVPASAEEYTINLTSGPLRPQLYAYRDADGWKLGTDDDAPLSDMFVGMAIWPALAASVPAGATAADVAAAYPGLRYVGTDTVEGRTAHVLMAPLPALTLEDMPLPGDARVSIDAETRQVLRVSKSSDIEPSEFDPGGHVDMVVTFGGYEAVNGVTLPRRWGMHLMMQTRRPPAELAAAREEMTQMLGEIDRLGSGAEEEVLQMRPLLEMGLAMLDGKPVDLAAVLQDVQVNAGPPDWYSDGDF